MKKKYLSALLSGMLLPGAGQIANKQYVKGGITILLTTAFFVGFMYLFVKGYITAFNDKEVFYENVYDFLFEGMKRGGRPLLISFLGLVAVWIYTTIDAYFFGGDAEDV